MTTLQGKVAIITGGASGMGKAASILFAKEGANVVVADLNVKGGEEVAAQASASGKACVFQRTDVSEETDVKALVARAVSEFGGLDIMFNNAGIGGAVGPLEEISVEDWDKTQAVCLRGVFLGIKHSVGQMRARGGGAIVNTASIAGVWGYPMLHAYSAAKAGVVNLTRSAALEFAADGIRVNCIAPAAWRRPSSARSASTRKRWSRRWRAASRCRVPASPTTSPMPRSISPARMRASSPGTLWWWMAARCRARLGRIGGPAKSAAAPRNACASRGRVSSRGEETGGLLRVAEMTERFCVPNQWAQTFFAVAPLITSPVYGRGRHNERQRIVSGEGNRVQVPLT